MKFRSQNLIQIISLLLILFSTSSSSSVRSSRYSRSRRGKLHRGQGTYYNPGPGACGSTDSDSSPVVALAAPDFDPSSPAGNPNRNPLCGRSVKITYRGRSVKALVKDRCPVCQSGDLDMSPVVFQEIANKDLGRIKIKWRFI
ncbi:hypothetical protein G9A89_009209 [Geosiphon pyriformis]|nr:hypothetical protein G9A89_009209 [Geosiphon pyriformis]